MDPFEDLDLELGGPADVDMALLTSTSTSREGITWHPARPGRTRGARPGRCRRRRRSGPRAELPREPGGCRGSSGRRSAPSSNRRTMAAPMPLPAPVTRTRMRTIARSAVQQGPMWSAHTLRRRWCRGPPVPDPVLAQLRGGSLGGRLDAGREPLHEHVDEVGTSEDSTWTVPTHAAPRHSDSTTTPCLGATTPAAHGPRRGRRRRPHRVTGSTVGSVTPSASPLRRGLEVTRFSPVSAGMPSVARRSWAASNHTWWAGVDLDAPVTHAGSEGAHEGGGEAVVVAAEAFVAR